jgi:hypothetical protein
MVSCRFPALINDDQLAPRTVAIHFLGDAIHDELHYDRLQILFGLQLFQLQDHEVLVELNVGIALEVARIHAIAGIGFQGSRQTTQIPFVLPFAG